VRENHVFFVDVFKSKTHKIGYQVKLKFKISQHHKDIQLMNNIKKYLGSGTLFINNNKSSIDLVIYKLSDIKSIILPLFNNHPLIGNKKFDFLDFCKIVSLVNNKEHLTLKGLESIKQIKSGMNKFRSL
jgi:hypothetical protein